MDNHDQKIPLLEGIGDELVYTTLILGGIIILFNLYWVYVVWKRRNEQEISVEQQSSSHNNSPTGDIVNNEDPTSQTNSSPNQQNQQSLQPKQPHQTSEQQKQHSAEQQQQHSAEQQQQHSAEQKQQPPPTDQSIPTTSTIQPEDQSSTNTQPFNTPDNKSSKNPSPIPESDANPLLNTPQEVPITATIANDLTIKLQFVNGLQRIVNARPEDTLGEFKRTHFSDEMSANKKVRLIMNGQELKNDSWNLRAYNICNNFVLHCLVSQHASSSSSSSSPSQNQQNNPRLLNLGSLVYPMIGAVLAFFWYARIYYRVYFNGASTFSLVVLSCFYIFSTLAFFRIPISAENLHQN